MRFRNLKKQSKNKPETKTVETIIYATYPNRIKALITDLFMIYMPILYIITYVFMDGADDFKSSQLAPFVGVLTYALIYSVLLAKFGQTPGKKAYDIQVVDSKSHQKIVIFRAFWRFICFIFSATTFFGLLLPLFRKDKKSLHDILSGTIVRAFKS
ncbi:MAG: RDD family protein [Sulfurimonas sp.]|nr:RDD family protein [Sulfurimonas sp.]